MMFFIHFCLLMGEKWAIIVLIQINNRIAVKMEDKPMSKVHVVDHPLIQHKLTLMRKTNCSTKDFRQLLEEISMLMAYEVTRELPLKEIEIETPICKCKSKVLDGKKLGIVCNLAPRPMLKGKYVSEGMIFAADTADGGCSIAFYGDDTPVGSRIH